MKNTISPGAEEQQDALHILLQAIASHNKQSALRMLTKFPGLAQAVVRGGATRREATTYFLKTISHFIYAGDTALHIAAAAYDRDIAEELVTRGANVSARNRRGAEPLHYAADGGPASHRWNPEAQYAIVEFLIRAGANPNSVDKSRVAPLHRAVRTRCTGAVRALLRNAADVRQPNGSGSTPLHLAVQNTGRGGSGSPSAREEQAKIIRLLLEHGASLSDKDSAGKTVKDSVSSNWIWDLLQTL